VVVVACHPSTTQVTSACDPNQMRFLSLFSGIDGIALGLERAGMKCVGQVEIDAYCREVLTQHWPDVPKYEDVRETKGDEFGPVGLVAGGFPCQPISRAGRRQVQDDDRWLWPHFARIIRVARPRFVLVENVPELLDPWYDRKREVWNPAPVEEVLADLETCGFHAEWDCIPSRAFGAPHLRDRVFIVAHTYGNGVRDESVTECWCERTPVFANDGSFWSGSYAYDDVSETEDQVDEANGGLRAELAGVGGHRDRQGGWLSEPPVFSVDDGIPYPVVRAANHAYGNAVVPQVIEWIGRRIMTVATEVAA
jgi:DNA (cytosine-5)-methyltransferase 1